MKKSYIILATALALVIAFGATIFVVGSGNYEDKTGWQRAVYAIVNRNEILETKFEGKISDYVWSEELEYRTQEHTVLQKTPGEDFVVMNVSDLHLSDYTQDAVTNFRNFSNVRQMAQELQPDLIILSGDLVWKESSVYAIGRLTEFMDSLGVPWAAVFGNHDDDGNCDLNYLADVMMQGKYCVMQKGDPEMGVGNYVVNICQGEKIVHSIILMDSHRNGKLNEKQIAWFQWAAEGAGVPSTLVQHIPIAQYQYGYDALWDETAGAWKENSGAFGVKGEGVDCSRDENDEPYDTGIFDVMKAVGTTNMLCGHDHANTMSVVWDDIRLTYSLRLGYGAYFEKNNQGVTTLTIGDDGEALVEHHYLYPYDVENP